MIEEPNFDEVLLSHYSAEDSGGSLGEATLSAAKARFLDLINKGRASAEAKTETTAASDTGLHVLPPAVQHEASKPVNLPSSASSKSDEKKAYGSRKMAAKTSVNKRYRKKLNFEVAGRSRSFTIEEVEGGIRLTASASDPKDLGAVACWTIEKASGELALKLNGNSIITKSDLLLIPYDTAVASITVTWR